MPELGTSGSVGAGGGRPPSATRPHLGLPQLSAFARPSPVLVGGGAGFPRDGDTFQIGNNGREKVQDVAEGRS